jgi:hypothetical protein
MNELCKYIYSSKGGIEVFNDELMNKKTFVHYMKLYDKEKKDKITGLNVVIGKIYLSSDTNSKKIILEFLKAFRYTLELCSDCDKEITYVGSHQSSNLWDFMEDRYDRIAVIFMKDTRFIGKLYINDKLSKEFYVN